MNAVKQMIRQQSRAVRKQFGERYVIRHPKATVRYWQDYAGTRPALKVNDPVVLVTFTDDAMIYWFREECGPELPTLQQDVIGLHVSRPNNCDWPWGCSFDGRRDS